MEERGSRSDPADEVLCFVTEEEATLFFSALKKLHVTLVTASGSSS